MQIIIRKVDIFYKLLKNSLASTCLSNTEPSVTKAKLTNIKVVKGERNISYLYQMRMKSLNIVLRERFVESCDNIINYDIQNAIYDSKQYFDVFSLKGLKFYTSTKIHISKLISSLQGYGHETLFHALQSCLLE